MITTSRVSLPSVTQTGAEIGNQSTVVGLSPGEVLVVDDILTSRLLLSEHIRQLGYAVIGASGGREALQLLAQRHFDLVMLDVSMPELDGFAVLDHVKADPELRSIPVIMVSAAEDYKAAIRCIAQGAEDYLHKPIEPVLLKARVQVCLEKKRLWDELQARCVQLRQLSRLQTGLTEMIVHDLRTPLTSVLSGLMTMEALGDLDGIQTEVLSMAITGSQTLLALVNNLLDISKLEDGTFRLDYEEGITVRDVLQQAADQVAALARERDLSIVLDAHPDLPLFCADRAQLTRVLVNLLGNAIKFASNTGAVTLSARPFGDGDRLIFSVKDSGEGIPEEEFQRIFEKFAQVESRKAGRKMSTGLGLTFCKMVAEAHGGRIWVESELGNGTTFSLTIPLQHAVRTDERRSA